jgi:hypothetical protein
VRLASREHLFWEKGREIFPSIIEEITEGGGNSIMRSFLIRRALLGPSNQGGLIGGACSTETWREDTTSSVSWYY